MTFVSSAGSGVPQSDPADAGPTEPDLADPELNEITAQARKEAENRSDAANRARLQAGIGHDGAPISPTTLILWSIVLAALVAIPSWMVLETPTLLLLAAFVFVTAAVPLLGGARRPVHHPSVIALALVASFVVPKAFWIATRGVNNNLVRHNLLRDHLPIALTWGLLALIGGYFGYSLGVMIANRPFGVPRWRVFHAESRPAYTRCALLLAAIFVVSFTGLVLFLRSTGFDLTPRKRFSIVGGQTTRVATIAYLWFRIALLARLGVIAGYFWQYRARQQGLRKTARILLWLVAANAIVALATPFFADNRAGVGLILIDVSVIVAALGSSRRRWVALIATTAVSMAVSSALLSSRLGVNQFSDIVESFVLARDLADFSKVGVIIESGFRTSGNSLWQWALMPLPPSYWPFPNQWATLGTDVWTLAYRARTINGVPPSLPGELFSAFGWLGVLGGMFLFGVLVKKVYLTTQGQLIAKTTASAACLVFLIRFNVFGLAMDFGTGVTKGLLEAVPLLIFMAMGERRGRFNP